MLPHGVDREDPEVGDRYCGEAELQVGVWQEHVFAPRRARVAWAASVERATLMANVHGAARHKLTRREDLGLEIAGQVDEQLQLNVPPQVLPDGEESLIIIISSPQTYPSRRLEPVRPAFVRLMKRV